MSESQNSQQIMNDIQSLQKMEQQMFSSLETNPNLSPSQKKDVSDKIGKISSIRDNLYKNIGGMNVFFKRSFESSRGTLSEQLNAVGIIEDQLKQARNRLKIMEVEKMNKVRLVEINDYFGSKYEEHALLMKIIILTLIPVIILILLLKKEIISSKIFYVLLVIVAIIGGIFMVPRFFSIIQRDNMEYQTYDWYFDVSGAPQGGDVSNNIDPWLNLNVGGCVESECCTRGMTYDTSLNRCVIGDDSRAATTTESFITETMIENMISSSSSQNKYKQRNNSNFLPKVADSFINYKM